MRTGAALSGAVLSTTVLAGCGGPVEIDVPDLDAADAAACDALAAELPEDLAEEERVASEPADAPGAAYGDPPIVVTCGVGAPTGFGSTSSCELVNGVGWYIPEDQYGNEPVDLTITAAGYRPRVEIRVPADYWPDGGPAAMAVVAPLVAEHTERVERCD